MTLALEDTATHVGPRAPERPAPTELDAGSRLGHFRIERKLGAGGMGEVYLATDLALDRPVAIKVLPSTTVSRNAHERMVREARAQARVQHPNVAHIYFIGEEEGRLYFAMEYVAGETLADVVAKGPMSVERALAAIRSSVLGLREAHRSGFTHRDVKPSNLMFDAHDGIKVLDFGLAAGAPDAVADGPVEQTSIAGTPLYMAPEQAAGDKIDQRADIYALGATLYHLVSGAPPFRADTIVELSILHATAARPALPRGAHARMTSAAIDALVAKMMALRPEDRFQTYDELLTAIDMASEQRTRPAGLFVRIIAQVFDLVLLSVFAAISELIAPKDIAAILMLVATLSYMALSIGHWGSTGGKSLLELEVVSIDTGKRPTYAAAFKREIAMLGPTFGFNLAEHLWDIRFYDLEILRLLTVGAAALTILHLIYASVRAPGKRTFWDRVSRTQVRYRAPRT